MKRIVASSLTIACLGILTACGAKLQNASLLENSKSNRASKMVFSVDLRPVDGALTEIILEKALDGKYDAMKRKVFVDRRTGSESDTTTEIASELTCKVTQAKISCKVDLRPVDGALKQLTITKRQDLKYDASLNTEFLDRHNGSTVSKTEELATGLSLAMQDDDAIVEIKASDANHLYSALETLGVVDTDHLIGATNLKVKDLRCSMDISNPARKILCNYSAVNAKTGALETFSGVEGSASNDLYAILEKHGFSVNAGINPSYRAIAAKSLICSMPVVPNPVANCVAERL